MVEIKANPASSIRLISFNFVTAAPDSLDYYINRSNENA